MKRIILETCTPGAPSDIEAIAWPLFVHISVNCLTVPVAESSGKRIQGCAAGGPGFVRRTCSAIAQVPSPALLCVHSRRRPKQTEDVCVGRCSTGRWILHCLPGSCAGGFGRRRPHEWVASKGFLASRGALHGCCNLVLLRLRGCLAEIAGATLAVRWSAGAASTSCITKGMVL